MELRWHPYRYYPYERELALREIRVLLSPNRLKETKHGIYVDGTIDTKVLERLVYFSDVFEKQRSTQTLQGRLERINGNGIKRQSTRYSAHGLHDYKGKFNPQVVRAILNILNVSEHARVLDPFCGSGTSLVECSHVGMNAIGVDINPMAVFIANAKLSSLQSSPIQLRNNLIDLVNRASSVKSLKTKEDPERAKYLERWFDSVILQQIEHLRIVIETGDAAFAPLFLSIASNLLRDYSQQDPHDLRIRRRKSALPKTPFIEAFAEAANAFILRIEDAQLALMHQPTIGKALLLDSRSIKLGRGGIGKAHFDCALTSPPYATALPYIDTQRLSLVWLGLLHPSEILPLDSYLIGSREIQGKNKKVFREALFENFGELPEEQLSYCRMLHSSLTDKDGFRRQALPLLLYRYFSDMSKVFRSVHGCIKKGAPFALIVGSNHTVLGGVRFSIDTPRHLTQIARSCGWEHEETIPLQTYQRYGYHMNNAILSEGLIILRAV